MNVLTNILKLGHLETDQRDKMTQKLTDFNIQLRP